MFTDRKAAQVAAFLLKKAGGSLNIVSLTKLLYLTERESMDQFGFPIIGDRMVSMPYGPVLSKTLDLANGNIESDAWEALIEDRENHNVKLRKEISREDLSAISDTNIAAIEAVWSKFGTWDKWKLVKFTHDECEEWEDPNGSSHTIPPKRVFRAVGKTQEQAEALAEEMKAQEHFDSIFGSTTVREPVGGTW